MRRLGKIVAGMLCAASVLTGCAHEAPDSQYSRPQALAERITRAVYADDPTAVVADFDDDLQQQVTRTDIGRYSDAMHQFGAIETVLQRSADADKGRYDYDVSFEHGAMIVHMRLDPSGKVGAFRLERR